MPEFGTIPTTTALSEANPESLRDILERTPSKLTREILEKQVEALRAHRERLAKGGGGTTPAAQKRATKKLDAPKANSTSTAEELGF